MQWPWSPPRPEAELEEAAKQARRQEVRRRVEKLTDDIQRLADELDQHKHNQSQHGGPKPWPT